MSHILLENHPDLATSIDILDQWIKHTTFTNHQPGLAIGIVHDGDLIWGKGYGTADRDKAIPVTLDTRFRIASVTKTFTAIAILQLRDAGKLRLDDTVSQYLDWYPYRYEDAPYFTIRNLLTHTAGLPRDAHKPLWTAFEAPTWAEFKAVVAQRQPTQPPNHKFAYSNFGYALLGAIITEVTGQSWADYVQEQILDPLNMNQTMPNPSEDDPQLARGYSRADDQYQRQPLPFFLMNGFEASANFASSINDLTKYANFHLGITESDVLSSHSLRDMHRVHWLYASWEGGYGFGTELFKVQDWKISGHSGGYPGYLTQFTICREHRTAVIVLTNAIDSNPYQYMAQAYKLVLPEIINATATDTPEPAPIWRKFVSQYESPWGSLSVVIRKGKLQMVSLKALDAPATTLEPTDDPHTFVLHENNQSNETLHFEVNDNGEVTGLRQRNEMFTRR